MTFSLRDRRRDWSVAADDGSVDDVDRRCGGDLVAVLGDALLVLVWSLEDRSGRSRSMRRRFLSILRRFQTDLPTTHSPDNSRSPVSCKSSSRKKPLRGSLRRLTTNEMGVTMASGGSGRRW